MLNSNIRTLIEDYSKKWNVGENIQVEIWHISVWIGDNSEISYWFLQNNWKRVIPAWLIESIEDWLELVSILESNRKKVWIVLSLSDIYKVTPNEREILKWKYASTIWLSSIFKAIGIDSGLIDFYGEYLEKWKIVVQSDWTKAIYNKIANIKNRYPRKTPETVYNEKGYILFNVEIWEYYWLILYSDWCFNNNHEILQYWIPLLIWEKEKCLATQCWPAVAWIHRQISNDDTFEIITIDNKNDIAIHTKSLRWQELMRVLYWKLSTFLTPINVWQVSFVDNHWLEVEKRGYEQLKKMCIEKLIQWWFESAKIHWEEEYLFVGNNEIVITCGLWVCNFNF